MADLIDKNCRLAIGIVSFQRGRKTQQCIQSILEKTRTDYQIFIADNGSTDRLTRKFIDEWEKNEKIKLIRLENNYGPSYGRNCIVKAANAGKFHAFAMLDNDTQVLANWDKAAIEGLNRGWDLIQPKLLQADRQTVDRGPNEPNKEENYAHPHFLGRGASRYASVIEKERPAHIVGTAGIIRKDVFDKIGLYDSDLYVGEDYDLSFRARKAGFTLGYVPDCEIIHDHGFEFEYDLARANIYNNLKSHITMWCKHQKALLSPAYLKWYEWMMMHGEPMYMPQTDKWRTIHRRLRRRIMRHWCMTRYPCLWPSPESAKQAADRLKNKLEL